MAVNPHQQIDFVFFYIKSKQEHSASFSQEYIWNFYVNRRPEMEINKMIYEEILQKLANDGYITTKVEPDVEQPSYNVTFKGRLFNGYEAEQAALVEHKARLDALENENHKLQIANTQNSSKLNSLTLILVIGTVVAAVYYLLEILNHWVCIYPKR